MAESRPFLVELPIVIKTYDVDFAGIVHNLVYIRWLEDLRLQILAERFPVEEMLADGLGPILTRTEIEYKRPLRLGDRPLGRMWVSHMGRSRWTVEAEITLAEQVTAEARQTGYLASMEGLRPARFPPSLQEQWRAAASK